jgi:hypothetical protein
MKSLIAICCAVFLLESFSAAQIRLQPSGGCGITEHGAMDCSWASAIQIRKPSAEAAARQGATALRSREYPTTSYNLAPGAPLDATSENYDRIVVALKDGHLANEAKATDGDFVLRCGDVLLLSKGEGYLFRNEGETNLQLLFVVISTDVKQSAN